MQKFVFVCGLHRSGTSLLADVLQRHPAVSGFQKTGVPKDEGQFLQSVMPTGRALGGPGKFGLNPKAHLTERSPLATPANSRKLYAQWSKYWDTTKPVLLEKSPPNLTRMRLLQALFDDAWFIVISRHPVPVSIATEKWTDASLPQLLEHWTHSHELYHTDLPFLRHAVHVQYENFVSAPQREVDRITSFLGIDPFTTDLTLKKGINDAYFREWRDRIAREPAVSIAATRLESRLKPFGYSFADAFADCMPASSNG